MVTFQSLPAHEENRRRAVLCAKNKAFKKARLAETWYMKLRYTIRNHGKNIGRKLEIYKRLFPESVNFIRALEGMAQDFS